MPQTLLSLAVIVRDQAALLGPLLRNHRQLYDEAVVVDTGSRDESARVAEAAGARVISSRWRQDFSAARNESLARCRGRWILVLDCDESIAPDHQMRLRAWLQEAQPCLGILQQRNYTFCTGHLGFVPVVAEDMVWAQGAPGYIPRQQIRILPGDRGLRYTGRIHETLEKNPKTYGLTREYPDAAIHHYGHLEGSGGYLRRLRRNGELLRREVKDHPHDPVLLTEFAGHLAGEGRREFAGRVCQRALEVAPGHSELFRTRLMLARLVWRDDPQSALGHCERALSDRPDVPDCWVEAVRANFGVGRVDRARLLLRKGLVIFPGEPVLTALGTQVSGEAADNEYAERG